ncbi:PH domain-containing protein [Trinickia acidisoli]|uniref:PH domain-containing protein n=1 Tax=Trinickia acidisoli TaxID=2767482 RepID=UPI001A8F9BDF|nr:PH domain-containing protein [Trinickia acidisoli]
MSSDNFEPPVPHDGRRIAFDGSPVWLVNLPLMLRGIAVLLLLVIGAVFVASRPRPVPWVVSAAFVVLMVWVLSKLAYRVTATACTRMVIDDERLTWRDGIFMRRVVSVELYRIQNVEARMTWWQRMAGFGTLIIESSDVAYPTWVLPGIPEAERLREGLIRYAIALRDVKGVREINTGKV